MKKGLQLLVLFFLIGGLFYACSDDEDQDDVKEYTLTVASVKPLEFPLEYCEGEGPSFLVKYESEDTWKNYQSIQGFTHEEGYEYVIRVRDERNEEFWKIINGGGVVCGGFRPDRIVTLLEVISKEAKDSKDIPVFNKSICIASKKTNDEDFPYYYWGLCWQGKWSKFAPIEGFDYEEGYEYRIEIDCKYNGMEASPKYSYTYVKTSSKEQKESERLPE